MIVEPPLLRSNDRQLIGGVGATLQYPRSIAQQHSEQPLAADSAMVSVSMTIRALRRTQRAWEASQHLYERDPKYSRAAIQAE